MAEKIVFETEINTGNSVSSVKSLKTELREITKQLGNMQQGTAEFEAAAKRAGQLQEKIRGVRDAIENADPEKRFMPFTRAVQGAAGAFAGLQGAMALFGSESKELEKTLVKVQGAMALSQGLNTLLEFKNDFADLGKLISGQVVKAFTTLRGAIAATGLGLLVIAVGALVANWKEFIGFLEKSIPGFDKLTKFFKDFRQIAVGSLQAVVEGFKVVGDVIAKLFQGEFGAAIDSAKEFGARVAKAYNQGYAEEDAKIRLENSIKQRKLELDLAEARGKDVKAQRIKLMQDELKLLEQGSDEYNAKLIEIEKARTDLRDKQNKERLEQIKKHEEELAQWRAEAQERGKKEDEQRYKERDEQEKLLQVDIPKKYTQEQINVFKNAAEVKRQIDLREKEAKLQSYQEISNALTGFAQLAGEQTAAGKAIAVAQTTIDTYVAAQKAYTSQLVPGDPTGPIRGAFFAAAAVASGLANVKRILSVNVPFGSGSSSGGSLSGAGAQVPQFNPALATQVQGAGDLTLNTQPQNNKVYVVESDIRAVQNKVNVIENNSKIG